MKKATLAFNAINGFGLALGTAATVIGKSTSTPAVIALLVAIASDMALQGLLSYLILKNGNFYKKDRQVINAVFLLGEIGTITSFCCFAVWNLVDTQNENLKILSACLSTITLGFTAISLVVLNYRNQKNILARNEYDDFQPWLSSAPELTTGSRSYYLQDSEKDYRPEYTVL
jgi:hypothetical protein